MTAPTRVQVVNPETGALEVGWVQRADPVFGDDLWLVRAPWWGGGMTFPGPVVRSWPTACGPAEGSTWWLWQKAAAAAVRIMSDEAPDTSVRWWSRRGVGVDETGGVYTFGGVELTPERLAVINGTHPE